MSYRNGNSGRPSNNERALTSYANNQLSSSSQQSTGRFREDVYVRDTKGNQAHAFQTAKTYGYEYQSANGSQFAYKYRKC